MRARYRTCRPRRPALYSRSPSARSRPPYPISASNPFTASRSSRQNPWLQALIATRALARRRKGATGEAQLWVLVSQIRQELEKRYQDLKTDAN